MSFGAPPRPGGLRPIKSSHFVYPFNDHVGCPSTVVYQNQVGSTLPPLASYAIYFVNRMSQRTLSEDSAVRLDEAIRQSSLASSRPYRLELFHVPDADREACTRYHVAERAARGSYEAQMKEVRHDQAPQVLAGVSDHDVFAAPYRPGLPPSYLELKGEQSYHPLFSLCYVSSWDIEEEILELVEYEPVAPDEYAKWNLEPGDDASDPETSVLPPYPGTRQAIRGSPRESDDGSEMRSVAETISSRSFFESLGEGEGTEGLFQEAARRGWMHW